MPALAEALGPANVKPAKPVMGAEDFGLFSEGNVPICMFWLGTIHPERLAAATAKGETMPRAALVEVLPRAGPEHRDRHPRDDRRRRQLRRASRVPPIESTRDPARFAKLEEDDRRQSRSWHP